MKERPILFSAPMVRAILAGTKTQTRRIVRVDDTPISAAAYKAGRRQRGIPSNAQNVRMLGYLKCDAPPGSATVSSRVECPYGAPGDRLWVRETHAQFAVGNRSGTAPQCVAYRATCEEDGGFDYVNNDSEIMRLKVTKWTPAIHMPRWASRITLEVSGVRVERLNAISDDDARAEGVEPQRPPGAAVIIDTPVHLSHVVGFRSLWCEINGDDSWDANPWVWVVEFKRIAEQQASEAA